MQTKFAALPNRRLSKPEFLFRQRQCKGRIIFRIIGMKVRKRQLRDLWRKAKDPQNVILKFQNSTTMKTMQNFAAQQLSKKQMNEVKGGAAAVFACGTANGKLGVHIFETVKEMVEYLDTNGGGKCNFLYEL